MKRRKSLENHKFNKTKISTIRYGALKKLEIPQQKTFKQTTIFSYVKDQRNNNFKAGLPLKDLPIKQDTKTLDLQSVTKSSDDCFYHSQSLYPDNNCDLLSLNKENLDKSDAINSFKATTDALFDDLPSHQPVNCPTFVPIQNKEVSKSNSSSTITTTTIDNTKWHSCKAASIEKESVENASKPLSTDDLIDYNLTMKFVSDSQGNQIFDRFTQKCFSGDDDRESINKDLPTYSDSEQQMYKNFENDILNNKLWQSTQNLK